MKNREHVCVIQKISHAFETTSAIKITRCILSDLFRSRGERGNMKLSLSNFLGIVVSTTMILVGILEIINEISIFESFPILKGLQLLNIPSLFIVLGGVLCVAFIMYQSQYVIRALGSILLLFYQSKYTVTTLSKDLEAVLYWNDQIIEDRVNALSRLEDEHADEISGFLFSLLSTNYSSEDIYEFGANYIDEQFSRKLLIVDILRMMGGAAPSFGMFGTLFGLIVMLGQLENPSSMGVGLAAALITTLYGISFARFIFYPISEKLKNIGQLNKFRDFFILEGVIMINDKKSSFYIQDKLRTFLERDFKE